VLYHYKDSFFGCKKKDSAGDHSGEGLSISCRKQKNRLAKGKGSPAFERTTPTVEHPRARGGRRRSTKRARKEERNSPLTRD